MMRIVCRRILTVAFLGLPLLGVSSGPSLAGFEADSSVGKLHSAAHTAKPMTSSSNTGAAQIVVANADTKGKKAEQEEEIAVPAPEAPVNQTPAEQYCSSVQDEAALAQLSLQKKEIERVQAELEKRIAALTEKSNEYKAWLKKREEFQNRATNSLVEIYAQMKAEAAAARLVAMNEFVAAAIISKLAPKSAGAVLSEMDTAKAARLSSMLAGAAEVTSGGNPEVQAQAP